MRKPTRILLNKDIQEVIEHYSSIYPEFTVSVGNYSTKIETPEEKILFSDTEMRIQAFSFYQKIKKDVGGEIRNVNERIKFFSFGKLKEGQKIESCYSVDINSAYLTALRNENVITENTFQEINEATRKSKIAKTDRLKAVGMFAKNNMIVSYKDGNPVSVTVPENPYSWVFFLACQKTTEAMQEIIKEMKREFILYWVDGIFLRENPERAVEILKKLNFESKIEKVENLRVVNSSVLYTKEGEEKILFLPKNQKSDKKEIWQKIEENKIQIIK